MTPPAFDTLPAAGDSPLLLLCDHASNRLPPGYGTLELGAELLKTHIAYDIGAAEVTRRLGRAYGAAAVLGRWSRLLVDLNRAADDPTIVMKLSDGSIIPGNRAVGPAEVAHRIAAYHAPYHGAVTREIARIQAAGAVPSLISIHSFTPSWKNVRRRWEVGILYDRDTRLAKPLMARLAEAGFVVGDNEPYSGALEGDALNIHGTRRGLPHVLIELRQDLIGDEAVAMAFADRLKPIIDATLSDMGPPRIELPERRC